MARSRASGAAGPFGKAKEAKPPKPTGLTLVDGLAQLERPRLQDFVDAASEYIVACETLEPYALPDGTELTVASRKKAGQIRLSAGLSRVLVHDLRESYPAMEPQGGEIAVSGALRVSQMDVVELTQLDGLKLAVELKPVNLAVGRAIWNRFGDIRFAAVNTHLKYPYAVVAGVLTVPTWETSKKGRKSTETQIRQLIELLRRIGGREREDDAPHRLEGVTVVIFDPDTATLRDDFLPDGEGLRWDEMVANLTRVYDFRFPSAAVAAAFVKSEKAQEAVQATLDDAFSEAEVAEADDEDGDEADEDE